MRRYFCGGFERRLVGLMLAACIGGCASTGPAPVEDRSLDRPPRARAPAAAVGVKADTYLVQRGDTLYSIAFRHGVDYRELADWNGIGAPYTIYVGQELRTSAPPAAAAPAGASRMAAAPPPPRPNTVATPTKNSAPRPGAFEPLQSTPAPTRAEARAATAPASSSRDVPPPAGTAAAPSATTAGAASTGAGAAPAPAPKPTAPPAPEPALPAGEVSWRWPAEGPIVGSYAAGDPTRQGIDIAGKSGDPVRAAADGAVVYSGNGLIGYGELIIIKHSPSFLSAYGHNSKRLVKEGDRVKAGQVIAEMGSSSASRDSLHFEIRRNGKPANPVDFLPRR